MVRLIGAGALAIALLLSSAGLSRAVDGWASHYGPGTGVAMRFCTWVLRHTQGCGSVVITSKTTGLSTSAPVVDWCYCIVPESAHPRRVVDLQWGVLDQLGLNRGDGLYRVSVEGTGVPAIPDTAMEGTDR